MHIVGLGTTRLILPIVPNIDEHIVGQGAPWLTLPIIPNIDVHIVGLGTTRFTLPIVPNIDVHIVGLGTTRLTLPIKPNDDMHRCANPLNYLPQTYSTYDRIFQSLTVFCFVTSVPISPSISFPCYLLSQPDDFSAINFTLLHTLVTETLLNEVCSKARGGINNRITKLANGLEYASDW